MYPGRNTPVIAMRSSSPSKPIFPRPRGSRSNRRSPESQHCSTNLALFGPPWQQGSLAYGCPIREASGLSCLAALEPSEVITPLLCHRTNALDCTRPRLLSPGLPHAYALLHELRQLDHYLASDRALVERDELFDFIGREISVVNRDNGLFELGKGPFHFLCAYTGELAPHSVRNFPILLL